jgi:hypothetical protein
MRTAVCACCVGAADVTTDELYWLLSTGRAKEVAQFNAVVQHSAFKSNPLSIIQRHLAASIEKQQL